MQKLYLQENFITTLPATFCNLPEECTIKIGDNCIAESYNCIPDPGDQNECASMNVVNYQPADYQLFTPFPNPFNSVTSIPFFTPQPGFTCLELLDLNGRLLKRLSHQFLSSGYHTINWDASDFSSGVYFIKMNVGDSQSSISQSQKVVLLK